MMMSDAVYSAVESMQWWSMVVLSCIQAEACCMQCKKVQSDQIICLYIMYLWKIWPMLDTESNTLYYIYFIFYKYIILHSKKLYYFILLTKKLGAIIVYKPKHVTCIYLFDEIWAAYAGYSK